MTGAAVLNFGQGIKDVAIPLLILQETGTPLFFGVALGAQQLPNLLLSPFAGTLIDRFNRKTALLASSLVRVLAVVIVFVITLTGFDISWLCLALLLLGFGEVLYEHSLLSVCVQLFPAEALTRVNGKLANVDILFTMVAGPVVGAFLFSRYGETALLACALCWLTACAIYRCLPAPRELPVMRRHFMASLRIGLLALWKVRLLRGLALGSAAMNGSICLWYSLVPPLGIQQKGLPEEFYGVVLSISGLAGMFAAGSAHRIGKRLSLRATMPLSLLAVSVSSFGLAVSPNLFLFTLCLCLYMMGDAIWTVFSATLRQEVVQHSSLGAVNGSYRMVGRGMSPIGSFAGGAFAASFGLAFPFILAAIVLLLSAVLLFLFWRKESRPMG